MTISRNAPCICGSGKKYKKCCLGKEMAAASEKKNDDEMKKESEKLSPNFFESDIDILSNSILDLISSNDFEKAKEVCKRLQDEYPDQVDGLEKLASVYEAEGNVEKAAEFYRKTIDFMKKNPGFDAEGIQWYTEKAEQLESKGK